MRKIYDEKSFWEATEQMIWNNFYHLIAFIVLSVGTMVEIQQISLGTLSTSHTLLLVFGWGYYCYYQRCLQRDVAEFRMWKKVFLTEHAKDE